MSVLDAYISIEKRSRDLYRYVSLSKNPFHLKSASDMTIGPGERVLVPTGARFALPAYVAGFVTIDEAISDRAMRCMNAPGLIDSGYRGEVKMIAQNMSGTEDVTIARGEDICWIALRETCRLVAGGISAPMLDEGPIRFKPEDEERACNMQEGIECQYRTIEAQLGAPAYAHEGDNGLDLRSSETFDLEPGARRHVPVGLAVRVPSGYRAYVQSRSGLAFKEGVAVFDAPALVTAPIDEELTVLLANLDPTRAVHVEKGDRIAQLVIEPAPSVCFKMVDALDETERSGNGFGSTGRG